MFFITPTSSSSPQPQLVTKPWQKGLNGLNVRIALPITTRNQAKPDYGHNILARLKSVTTQGHGVFMSHSRWRIFLLSMIPCSLKISLKLFEKVWFFSLTSGNVSSCHIQHDAGHPFVKMPPSFTNPSNLIVESAVLYKWKPLLTVRRSVLLLKFHMLLS